MKFYVYSKYQLESKVHESKWACTPLLHDNIGKKPLLNNSFHPIGDFSLLKQENSDEADYFIVPYLIRHTHHFMNDSTLNDHLHDSLPYFSKSPEKHIFFIGSDDNKPIKCLEKSIKFSFSVSKSSEDKCLYYQPVVSVPDKISPIIMANYDISFQGYLCNELRRKAAKQLISCDLKTVVINTRYWLEKFMQNDTKEIERNYCGLMQMSKFVLCPRGFGLSSVRFFETLAFGRIPVLISDDTKLPLEEEIDYDKFIIRVEENDLESIESKIIDFKKNNDLMEVSKISRETWEKWFCPEKIEDFIVNNLC